MKQCIRRLVVLTGLAAAVAALTVPMLVPFQVRIVYNPSDSVARGWYLIAPMTNPSALQPGRVVLARLPAGAAAFAAQRGYLPESVPILKRVGAVAPQSVCVQDRLVRIDGIAVATVRTHDGAHRPMLFWSRCRPLMGGELFLLSSTNLASFDSRYFGPIDTASVLGVAHPLWTTEVP
ncbi:MAG: S26 family signal peptidase [Rhodoferax sp.]|nr:S26 family signal peptidase [Comamonadaceae bacterium]MBP6493264.1 S26 family signal peptidase [Rhodoferax sp.]